MFEFTAGPKCEAKPFHNQPIPAKVAGEHLWIMTGLWRVNPTRDQVHLDMENLISVDGPGCFWCEETYSPALSAKQCRGHGR